MARMGMLELLLILGLLFVGLLVLIALVVAVVALARGGRVPCQYCGERISADAHVCRYCGRDVDAEEEAKSPPEGPHSLV